MDISSTTSTPTATVSNEANCNTQVQKTSEDSSFKNEMNKVSNEEKNTKTEDTKAKTNDKTTDSNKENIAKNEENTVQQTDEQQIQINNQQNVVLAGEINTNVIQNNIQNITEENFAIENNIRNNIQNSIQTLINANRELETVTQYTSAPTKVDYSTIQMNSDDAKFFTDLVQDTDATLQNVATALQQGIEAEVQKAEKTVKVSATLMNALSEAQKTNQPFRIDFDKDISIIIKIDKDGTLSAKFIPGDQAVEQYIKQNISLLRQRFDDQELSYKELSYTNSQNRERNRRNNKENAHE